MTSSDFAQPTPSITFQTAVETNLALLLFLMTGYHELEGFEMSAVRRTWWVIFL